MKRVLALAFLAAVVLPFTARAQAKTDFSGAWTLDASKSDPGRGGAAAAATVVIKQTPADITIETKRGENTQVAVYKLDGSPSTNTMMGRGGQAAEVVSKAHWDGANLVIETTREVQGQPVTSKETRSLDAGGKEMKVETAFGDRTNKHVFAKTTS